MVRVSFSAPNASQQCGAFLFVGQPVCPLPIVQVSRIWSIIRPIPEGLCRKPRSFLPPPARKLLHPNSFKGGNYSMKEKKGGGPEPN